MTEHVEDGQHEHAVVEIPIADLFGVRPPLRFRDHVMVGIRTVVSGGVIALIIVGVLIVGFHTQTAAQVQREQDTLHANLAQACVLALPVDPVNGRDPDNVKACFTQYGLQAPLIQTDPTNPQGP
jgi:hypothetical protein